MTLKEKTKEYSDALVKAGVIDPQHIEDSKEDFESGAKFIIQEIYKALTPKEVATPIVILTAVYDCLEELEREPDSNETIELLKEKEKKVWKDFWTQERIDEFLDRVPNVSTDNLIDFINLKTK